MEIRPITTADLPSVASVHILAFPDAALSKLGIEAIRRYYAWQLNGPHDAVCVGAFVNRQMTGFCFAGVFRGTETGFLIKNRYFLAWRLILQPWLLADKTVAKRVKGAIPRLRSYVKRQREKTELAGLPATKGFGILAIAVHPQHQRLGIGNILMQKIEELAILKGFHSMHLSVHPSNLHAVSFYEKLGWRRASAPEIEWWGLMTKNLVGEEDTIHETFA
jgi:ribosomal protein S18 acetylase RimI-like enzyme